MADEGCLIEMVSPHGSVEAFVSQDDRVAFFYLRGAPESGFGFKSCWVRNLHPAPIELDVANMRNGIGPMLPAPYCRHPSGAPPLKAADLSVVWFEEGDAAALVEGTEVLAIIPSWSGTGGFDGYARDCVEESPLCWPFPEDNVLLERISRSQDYWHTWSESPNPWEFVQNAQCDAYAKLIGTHQNYYAIDGGNWPPKAMLRIDRPGVSCLVTVGVSLRAQPSIEQYTGAEPYRRIELGVAQSSEIATKSLMPFARYLSGQSALPWTRLTWLGPYHTIPCDAFGPDSVFTSVLLVPAAEDVPAISLPAFRGDPVSFLWMIPITNSERTFAMDAGGKALLERLKRAGYGAICVERKSVV